MSRRSDYGVTSNKFLADKTAFTVPHFLIPSLNCTIESTGKQTEPIQNYVQEYRCMPYKHTMPVPLNDPMTLKGESICRIDHVTKLISDKNLWNNEKKDLIFRNSKLKSRLFYESDKFIRNWKRISKETVRLAEHIDSDPDPNFSGYYNWYYSDGCLNNLLHNNITSLLYANDSSPGTCIVTPIATRNLKCSLLKEESVFLNTGHKQRIFQINVNNNFVAVRQKKYTSLFTITSDNDLVFKKIHKHSETDDSILSVSISNDLDGEYCTLTTSQKLKLWSPEVKNECISTVNIDKNETVDCWGFVKYMSKNNILVSDRTYVYLKDTRIGLEQNVQKWKPQVKEIQCDFISMIMKSRVQDNCAYVGTAHHLFELDFRSGLSKQWTHMMELPPMYGVSNFVYDVNETLFFGSQSLNEVCTVNCDMQVMPFILPSPDETLSEANAQGLCLDPTVASRFNFSMTGLTTVSNSSRANSVFVFRTNSIGDIFYQSAIHKDDCNNDLSDCSINLESLSKWELKCEKSVDTVINSPLKVNDVIDFTKLNDINSSKVFSLRHAKRKKQKSSECNQSSWRISKRRIFSPRDNFSQSLVSVWDIEDVDSEQESHTVNDKSNSEEYSRDSIRVDRQTDNGFNHEDAEKIGTRLGLARKDTFHEQFSSEDSRTPYRNVTNSIALRKDNNFDSVLSEDQNETHHEVFSIFATPKRFVRDELKQKVKKKTRFSSGF